MVERIDLAASRPSRTVTGMVGRPTVYGVSVTYTVEVTDRSALMAEAFERFCGKLRPGEKVTARHSEQWQRWGR